MGRMVRASPCSSWFFMVRAFFDSLAAIRGEALGLQVIKPAAARALDLNFIEDAGFAQQGGAVATLDF